MAADTSSNLRLLFTIREFCKLTGISKSTFYNLERAGQGPDMVRIGRKAMVSEAAARRWVRRIEEQGRAVTDPRVQPDKGR